MESGMKKRIPGRDLNYRRHAMINDILKRHSTLIHLNHITIYWELGIMSVQLHQKSSKKEIRAMKAKMEAAIAITSTQAKQLQVQVNFRNFTSMNLFNLNFFIT
jgi:hypothetical protein